MKRFFHLATAEEWGRMVQSKFTWEDVKDVFQQPAWRNYPGALDGEMGCWSLVGRMVTGEEYCRSCECHKDYKEP